MERSKKIKNSVYFIGLAILCSLLIVSTFNVYKVLIANSEQQTDVVYSYQEKGNIDYKVYLLDNNFITEKYLGKDQYYISQIVDYIATDFNYQFSGNNNAKLKYTYGITGTIIGSYKDSAGGEKAVIWNKEYILKEAISKEIEDDNFVIDEKLNIDLTPYNNEVAKFRQNLGILVEAKLVVEFNINIEGTTNDKTFTDEKVVYMEMPLGTTIFNIDGPYNINNNENILKTGVGNNAIDITLIINGSIAILSILLLIIVIKKYIINNKSEYQLELDNILNTHGNRIVIINKFLDITEDKYVNIDTFNELIDLVDEVNEPILCWISNNKRPAETWFIVIHEKVIYRYILKDFR